jgi:hypothetical protein
MLCPKCNGEMWDNTNNKTNPKAPDYRCKNKDCKWQLTKDSQWILSEYPTALWQNQLSALEKFNNDLEKSLNDEKWNEIRKEKTDNIAWLNAKNNAVELVAHHPYFAHIDNKFLMLEEIKKLTKEIYLIENIIENGSEK